MKRTVKDPSRKITGGIGEAIVAEYLKVKGFSIVEQNYSIRYGELDIIAEKAGTLFFVEVKTFKVKGGERDSTHRPEENVHPGKMKSLARTINYYLSKKYRDMPDWKFLVIAVRLDDENKVARVKIIEDIIEA